MTAGSSKVVFGWRACPRAERDGGGCIRPSVALGPPQIVFAVREAEQSSLADGRPKAKHIINLLDLR